MTNMLLSPQIKPQTSELDFDNSLGNSTYYTDKHLQQKTSWIIIDLFYVPFRISIKDEELDLSSLYWIPKLHKCPYKQRYIAGSSKCSTKPLFKLLTLKKVIVKLPILEVE